MTKALLSGIIRSSQSGSERLACFRDQTNLAPPTTSALQDHHMLAHIAQHHRVGTEVADRSNGAPWTSSTGFVILVVAAAIMAAIAGRVIIHRLDVNRVRNYAQAQGWQLLSAQWTLFGPGWFGGGKERLYKICYTDGEGRTHNAYAKTSVLAGVYLTEDKIV